MVKPNWWATWNTYNTEWSLLCCHLSSSMASGRYNILYLLPCLCNAEVAGCWFWIAGFDNELPLCWNSVRMCHIGDVAHPHWTPDNEPRWGPPATGVQPPDSPITPIQELTVPVTILNTLCCIDFLVHSYTYFSAFLIVFPISMSYTYINLHYTLFPPSFIPCHYLPSITCMHNTMPVLLTHLSHWWRPRIGSKCLNTSTIDINCPMTRLGELPQWAR